VEAKLQAEVEAAASPEQAAADVASHQHVERGRLPRGTSDPATVVSMRLAHAGPRPTMMPHPVLLTARRGASGGGGGGGGGGQLNSAWWRAPHSSMIFARIHAMRQAMRNYRSDVHSIRISSAESSDPAVASHQEPCINVAKTVFVVELSLQAWTSIVLSMEHACMVSNKSESGSFPQPAQTNVVSTGHPTVNADKETQWVKLRV